MSSTDLQKWGDDAMYYSQPIKKEGDLVIEPRVYLLSATPDPLGALAAGMRMYRGDPVYSLGEISDEDRRWAWEESIKTHLKAPWEFIDFQFMIEGVTRAFTHQMVRQRTAVYAQESLRFAVKEGLAQEIPVPPSVAGSETATAFWEQAVKGIERSYNALVRSGIPAEDARGLLPHATTTRLIYKTNFRGLMEHAGNRLCTQAQMEWRAVFMGIISAIRNYVPPLQYPPKGDTFEGLGSTAWQFVLIAKPRAETFAPVCYQKGHCVFMSELDRGCTIRDRVQKFAKQGVSPSDWGHGHGFGDRDIIKDAVDPINPAEWMANSSAGITTEDNPRPDAA